MVCKNCGIANSDASRFCSECGSVLPKPKAEQAPAQPPETEYTAPAFQPPVFPVMPNMAPPVVPFSYLPPMNGTPIAPPNMMPTPVPFAPVAPAPVAEEPKEQASVAAPAPAPQATPETPPAQATVPPVANAAPFGIPMQPPGAYAAAPMMPGMQPSPYVSAQMPYPPAYQPFGYSPLFKDPYAGKATWVLWLGILAAVLPIVTCSYASPVALVLGIVAICLGAANIRRTFEKSHSKMLAGIIVGSVGILFSLFGCGVLVKAIGILTNSNEFKQFSEQFNTFIAYNMLRVMKFTSVAVKAVVVQVQAIIKILFLK